MSDASDFMRRLKEQMNTNHHDDDDSGRERDTEQESDYDDHATTNSTRWRPQPSLSASKTNKMASHWNLDDDEEEEEEEEEESDADNDDNDDRQDYTQRLREKLRHRSAGRMSNHRSDDSLASMDDLRPSRFDSDDQHDMDTHTTTKTKPQHHYSQHLRHHSMTADDTQDEEEETVYQVKKSSPVTSFGRTKQRPAFSYGQDLQNDSELEPDEEDYTSRLRSQLSSNCHDRTQDSEEEEEEKEAIQSKWSSNSRGPNHSQSFKSAQPAVGNSHMNFSNSSEEEEEEEEENLPIQSSANHTASYQRHPELQLSEDDSNEEEEEKEKEEYTHKDSYEDEDPTTPVVSTSKEATNPAMDRIKSLMERMPTQVSDLIEPSAMDSNDEDDIVDHLRNDTAVLERAHSAELFKDDGEDDDDDDDDYNSSGDDPETDRRIEEALNMSSSLADLLGKARQSSSEREAAERQTQEALNAGQDVQALMGKLRAEEEASKAAAAAIAEQDIDTESDEEEDEPVNETALAAMLRRQPPPPLSFADNESLPSNPNTPLEEFPDRPPTMTDSQSLNRQSVGSALSTPNSEKIRSSGSSVTSMGMHHMPPSPKDPSALMPPPTPAESIISFKQNMTSRLSYFFRPSSPLPNPDGSAPLSSGSDSLGVHQRRGSCGRYLLQIRIRVPIYC
ncbi:hypothetical protein BDF19DRAFT_275710 [Syncephalis fuscata]|nr:hypothetical protein BDF19DRAFT_275710 [Syncephalis fuscata]